MTKKNAKTEQILDATLELLNTGGDFGVTMRQVATKAGVSLSNVQYYFKTKDDLLIAVADRYFARCLEEIRQLELVQSPEALKDDIETLLRTFLQHGLEVSEMCRIFREYWAISTRNASIDEYVKQYYQDVVTTLAEKLHPVAKSERGLAKALSIFVPYVEGYSIAALSMPEDIDSVTAILGPIMVGLIQGDEPEV